MTRGTQAAAAPHLQQQLIQQASHAAQRKRHRRVQPRRRCCDAAAAEREQRRREQQAALEVGILAQAERLQRGRLLLHGQPRRARKRASSDRRAGSSEVSGSDTAA